MAAWMSGEDQPLWAVSPTSGAGCGGRAQGKWRLAQRSPWPVKMSFSPTKAGFQEALMMALNPLLFSTCCWTAWLHPVHCRHPRLPARSRAHDHLLLWASQQAPFSASSACQWILLNTWARSPREVKAWATHGASPALWLLTSLNSQGRTSHLLSYFRSHWTISLWCSPSWFFKSIPRKSTRKMQRRACPPMKQC